MKKILLFLLACVILAGCTDPTMSALEADLQAAKSSDAKKTSAPVNLTFSKEAISGTVWEGTVGGDLTGQLETRLLELRETGPVWHVVFDWIVTADDPAKSFTARLKGTLHTKTGKVVMNGQVIEGWLEGAQVHEEGQLIDPKTYAFEGIIRIMAGSAN
jgi:predicted small secreted protein